MNFTVPDVLSKTMRFNSNQPIYNKYVFLGVFLHVMADALGSVIVIISALIMWFLPCQVHTSMYPIVSCYVISFLSGIRFGSQPHCYQYYLQEETEDGEFVDLPENQWTKYVVSRSINLSKYSAFKHFQPGILTPICFC